MCEAVSRPAAHPTNGRLRRSTGWLLRLWLMMPVVHWDHYADRIDANGDTDKHGPLFHLSNGGSEGFGAD